MRRGTSHTMRSTSTRTARKPWHALYTRSRHEKKVAAVLEGRGFAVYLPVVPRESRWHDRTKIVVWPLFPGYVFARFSRAETATVLCTAGVASVVRVAGVPATIPDDEIENVRAFVEAIGITGEMPRPEPLWERGQTITVIDGPFRGLRGVVLEQRGDRVTIQVGLSVIRQAVRLEICAGNITVGSAAPDGR